MQQPRQMYGLGSFVKKAVKGVTGAAKSVAGGIKDIIGSDAGKLALLAAGAYGLGGAKFLGGKGIFAGGQGLSRFANLANLPGAISSATGFDKMGELGRTAAIFGGGSVLAGLLSQAEEQGDPEGITRDVGALRNKLTQAYKLQRTFSDAPDEEAAIAAQVESDLSEYTSSQGGYATGGRVGLALGSPENNAIQASGIMGLPLNQNPAGVTELDLRETGGFIPPVGVKEKEDDIPAMLSNNEFVFTADAVRGMGGGDVNKGAQRLYDQMKMLEKGGRV